MEQFTKGFVYTSSMDLFILCLHDHGNNGVCRRPWQRYHFQMTNAHMEVAWPGAAFWTNAHNSFHKSCMLHKKTSPFDGMFMFSDAIDRLELCNDVYNRKQWRCFWRLQHLSCTNRCVFYVLKREWYRLLIYIFFLDAMLFLYLKS